MFSLHAFFSFTYHFFLHKITIALKEKMRKVEESKNEYKDTENYNGYHQQALFAWGWGEHGQLGLGDKRYVTATKNIAS